MKAKTLLLLLLTLGLISNARADLIYLAKVDFSGKIFNDILTLRSLPRPGRLIPPLDPKMANGTFTSPGNFTTKVHAVQKIMWSYLYNMEIAGETVENGNPLSFRILVHMDDATEESFSGTIFGEEGGTEFEGKVTLTLLHKD
jgi:hypothetical protein